MGKGDVKTRRGKLIMGSYGVIRPKKKHKQNKVVVSIKATETKPTTKKAPLKKEEVISEIVKPDTAVLKPQDEKKKKEVKETKVTDEVVDDTIKTGKKAEKKPEDKLEEKPKKIVKTETVTEKPKKKEPAKTKDKD